MIDNLAGIGPAFNRLTRFFTSHWDEQPRVEILGVNNGDAAATIRYRASRATEFVRVHVQHDGAGGGGSTYNASTYVSDTQIDCRLNRQQEVTVTKSTNNNYYVWLAPEYRDGDGTYSRFTGEAGQGEDFMAFVSLGGGSITPILTDPLGDQWRVEITQYGGIKLVNLSTAAERFFYAVEEGTDIPTTVADHTIYFQTPEN